jgi:hypothetical protein
MAHLWLQDDAAGWSAFPLGSVAVDIGSKPPRVLNVDSPGDPSRVAMLVPFSSPNAPPEWALLAGPAAAVSANGQPVRTGIHVLSDRDEIRVKGQPSLFFSTERLARAEPFPGADREILCPRCKQEINKGILAVECPSCLVWYHQSEELPCYTYAEKCATCSHGTSLDAGFSWTPEEQ